jgi:hypothetical protein
MSVEGTANWYTAVRLANLAQRAEHFERHGDARFLPTLGEHRAAARRDRLAQIGATNRLAARSSAVAATPGTRVPSRAVAGLGATTAGPVRTASAPYPVLRATMGRRGWVSHDLGAGRSEGHADERELRAGCRHCR